jgi:hypothetical protein
MNLIKTTNRHSSADCEWQNFLQILAQTGTGRRDFTIFLHVQAFTLTWLHAVFSKTLQEADIRVYSTAFTYTVFFDS